MKNPILLTTVLLLFALTTFSQAPAIQWDKTFGGGSPDVLRDLKKTSDGGYIAGGYSSSSLSGTKTENSQGGRDYWVVKLNSSGSIDWQNTIGGNSDDELHTIAQTSDGGYIAGGYSSSGISGDKTESSLGGLYDYWVVKLNSSGSIVWQTTIGGSLEDELHSIMQTSDGGFILGGHSKSNISGDKTENSQGGWDMWVIKLDASGNIIWQNTIGGSGHEYLYSVSQTSDGGYILGGPSESNISGDKSENNQGNGDYWVIKLDASGNIVWQNTIGGSNSDELWSVSQTTDGGYILGGFSGSNISGDKTENSQGGSDMWIVKLTSTGIIQWQNTIGGNSNDLTLTVSQTTDGGYIIGGYSDSGISGDKTENARSIYFDYWIVKTNSTGALEWQKTIGGGNYDQVYAIAETGSGEYIVGGASDSNISGEKTENSQGSNDYWIVKLAPASTAIPTLSEWGLIIFGLLLLCTGAVVVWRGRYARAGAKA